MLQTRGDSHRCGPGPIRAHIPDNPGLPGQSPWPRVAFWGLTAAVAPGPRHPHRALHTPHPPVPSKAVRKPSLPAPFQAWHGPERRRHNSGGCPRKTRWPPAALFLLAPLAPRKSPGQQHSASSPRARLCAQRERDLTAARSGDPCLAGAPRRETIYLLQGDKFSNVGWETCLQCYCFLFGFFFRHAAPQIVLHLPPIFSCPICFLIFFLFF